MASLRQAYVARTGAEAHTPSVLRAAALCNDDVSRTHLLVRAEVHEEVSAVIIHPRHRPPEARNVGLELETV